MTGWSALELRKHLRVKHYSANVSLYHQRERMNHSNHPFSSARPNKSTSGSLSGAPKDDQRMFHSPRCKYCIAPLDMVIGITSLHRVQHTGIKKLLDGRISLEFPVEARENTLM